MQTSAIFLLVSLAFVLPWKTLAIDTEDVHKMASEISSFTSATYDIIAKMKHISKHAATFIRLATPIGSLVAAGAEVVFPPESEEFKAIKELQKIVVSKFAALSRHVQMQTNEIKHFLIANDYFKSVTHPLNGIERFHSEIIDPYANRSEHKADFIARCKDRSSPHDVLLYLKARLYTSCPLPSTEETEEYATVFTLFRQLERKTNLTAIGNDYEFIKQSLLAKSSLAIVAQKLKIIVTTGNHTSQVQEALQNLHEYLHGSQDICWLKTVFEGNKWKRDQLYHFAELIRLDLIKATIIAANCANISNDGNVQKTEKELQTIEVFLSEISHHVSIWMEQKLKISWPIIMRDYASAATGDAPVEESAAKYSSIARDVKKVLDHMGPAGYFHNVLVYPNWKDGRQFAQNCPPHNCLSIMDVNDLNIIVIRYNDNQYEKADRAFDWFNKKTAKEMGAIVQEWYIESASQQLDSLMERLKEELEGFTDPDLYENVILLRNWMFFKKDATITIGYTMTNIRGISTQQGLDSVFNPYIHDAEHYHVHMFI